MSLSNSRNDDISLQSALLIVFICVLFGGNAVAIKFSLQGLGGFTAAGLRFGTASMIIILWARFTETPLRLTRRQVGQTLFLSGIFVCQLSLFYHGLERTTASHGVLISNVLPFFVLILAHFFIPGDRITLKKALGMVFGFAGVLFLFFDAAGLDANLKTGDIMVLCAVGLWSISAVRVKQINAGYNAIQITLYPMMFAVPFFLLAGFFWDEQMISNVEPPVILAMIYQTFVTASFGFLVWNNLLQRFGATALHSFLFIMPLAGVMAGVTFLDETVTPYLAASILFIVLGVMVVNIKRKTPPSY